MIINFIRSVAFNIAFYGWSALCFIAFIPLHLFPKECMGKASRLWTVGLVWICRWVMGIRVHVEGKLPDKPVLIASKHQSAWETFIFHYLLPNPAIILKEQLMRVPLLGWHLKTLGMIPISRSKTQGSKDLKKMLEMGKERINEGRSILIFPEGTRAKIGEPGTYQEGISIIYKSLGVPVVPVAHNAGVLWPRKSFIKKPGTITLSFLPEIPAGLPRKEFMDTLTNAIETKTTALVKEQMSEFSQQ